MTDLISRSAVIDRIAEFLGPKGLDEWEVMVAIREIIENAPAVDAVPMVHAMWLLSSTPGMVKVSYDGWIHCPNCAGTFRRIVGTQLFAFCPNCGARMDAEEI